MTQISRRKFVGAVTGTLAGLAIGAKMTGVFGEPVTANAATADDYAQKFLEQYNKIKKSSNGYFSPQGVPYHSIETLMVEAPDHGHESTSEAFSYWMLLEAAYGRFTGDWAPFNAAWAATEKYIIPTSTSQPTNDSYNASSPATYIPESPSISDYPGALDKGVSVGQDPIAGELKSAYGTADIYGMHWLLDVDNVYGYGNTAGTANEDGPTAKGPCYINSYQRGCSESVWETVPQPSIDLMKYGGTNGYLDLFVKDSSYAKQWKFTNAPDADARAVQAAYWAYRWASEQGKASAISSSVAKAAKMGDYLRYSMFDKYFKKIGDCTSATSCAAGTGREAQHYLLGWYYAWGGGMAGAGWAWRIGDGVCHHGYQNPVAAWALSTVSSMAPKSSTGKSDWGKSLTRQIEFLTWLQSADGAIAGGCSNSWDGRYGKPESKSTFYGMAYDVDPVYHDPASNEWFGMQIWGMERWAEYYYLSKDAKIKPVMDKWIAWILKTVTVGANGEFSVPSKLGWSGEPDTWNAAKPGSNANLRCTVLESGTDVGVTAGLIRALLYYGAAADNAEAKALAKSLLDALSVHADAQGVAIPESRKDYSRFLDPVYVPKGWTGKMPNGDVIDSKSTFLSIRSFYKKDPEFAKVQKYLDGGEVPTFTYHRFWAQADVALAYALYSELILGGGTISPSPTVSESVSESASASASASVSPSAPGDTGLTATYKVDNQWSNGFVATVTVTNNGSSAIKGWKVTWNWGGSQQISSGWSATVTQSGSSVTATNLNWNGGLAPGASASFGFQGTFSGTNTAPTLTAIAS